MNKTKQIIQKSFTIDAGHRIVNHSGNCGFVHGHLWTGTLSFSFQPDTMEDSELGYAIDFTEIKRVGIQFINDYFDHGYIANPKDYMVDVLTEHNSKLWLMSLNGKDKFCNPSVENMAKELFLIMNLLFEARGVKIETITLYETPTSSTICDESSITFDEIINFNNSRAEMIKDYAYTKGIQTYNKTKNN